MGSSFILSGRSRALEAFNRAVPWYRLPKWLALANLSQIRKTLREENLHDTNRLDTDDNYEPEWDTASAVDQSVLQARTADGTYNDLEGPRMGAKGMRFGRNIPLAQVKAANPSELLTPNPRTISETLLARREFVPATSLNVLACAWIQFM
ncbi:MAG TPA: peroxidase family protein, partial [Polyangiaceae bacterium]|nr:peroxidase family protein [Polyangiaceae bacterium]